ncbi:MAG TPA: response regulator transcription factor [Candidatus Dormibacteraeota bacterium]|nr:response regulator transcription factor [Candidatus Dormibacteraeota bacterium]
MAIRVLVADDQALVRAGLRRLLEEQPDIEVVGEAGDGREAIAAVERLRPDVVLMDIRMPELDGIEATRQVGRRARVVILTTYELDEYVFDGIAAGACGFLLKHSLPEEMIRGVRAAASGDALLAPSVTRRLIAEFTRRQPPAPVAPLSLDALTEREGQVLRLVARGLSNQEIASTLQVSEWTVKTHVGHLLDKLGLRDRVQAVVLAYESGLVQPGS